MTVVGGQTVNEIQKKTPLFTVVAYLVPFLISLGMLLGGLYGVTDEMICWIDRDNSYEGEFIVGNMLFYVPVFVGIVFNSVVLWKVVRYLDTIMSKASQVIINRLKLYPLILILCWTPGILYRLTMVLGYNVFPLFLLHTIMSGLPGLFNCIAYGMQQ